MVTSADIVNNQSVFIARAIRSDRIISQGSISVKHVDTAIWTGITPPSDAIDGAIWVGSNGEQKLKVDACEPEVVTFDGIFSQPFAQKTVAIKVTKEMVEAARKAILEAFSGAIDGTAYAKEGGQKAISAIFEARAAAAVILGYKPDVLEKLQGIIATGCEVLEGAGRLAEHAPAIELILANIQKALAPKAVDLSADDI